MHFVAQSANEKGDLFEQFCKALIASHKFFMAKDVYLGDEVPTKEVNDAKLTQFDRVHDLLFMRIRFMLASLFIRVLKGFIFNLNFLGVVRVTLTIKPFIIARKNFIFSGSQEVRKSGSQEVRKSEGRESALFVF